MSNLIENLIGFVKFLFTLFLLPYLIPRWFWLSVRPFEGEVVDMDINVSCGNYCFQCDGLLIINKNGKQKWSVQIVYFLPYDYDRSHVKKESMVRRKFLRELEVFYKGKWQAVPQYC